MASVQPSAVERKKAEANENTFVIRPGLRARFPVPAVKDVIRAVLKERLSAEGAKYGSDLGKELSEAVKSKLKAMSDSMPRYKLLVHACVGENRGAGMRVGTRCLWDTTTDAYACESLITDSMFAIVTVYGVYLY